MKAIGGYFELELDNKQLYHQGALALNSARNCLELILKARNVSLLYIPFYTCEVILEPLHKLGIEYRFYNIDSSFEIVDEPELKGNSRLLYTNYFALKEKYINRLSEKYGNKLIVDNAQAFFAKRIQGIDTFYSPRKFFGVADGGYLYADDVSADDCPLDCSYDRMDHLLKRLDKSPEFGYEDFQKNDSSLKSQPIRRMSVITSSVLNSLDYCAIMQKRIENFNILHTRFSDCNRIAIPEEVQFIPFAYPLLFPDSGSLRQFLIRNRVFVATYWPNVLQWCKSDTVEYQMGYNILPLPVDQRYSLSDMNYVVELIYKFIGR